MRLGAGLLLLVACLAAATGAGGCTSTVEEAAPAAEAQLFDFTQEAPATEHEPVDPKNCRHVWVPSGTHPYMGDVNGMPMMRLCFILICDRCGLVRHECTNPRARP